MSRLELFGFLAFVISFTAIAWVLQGGPGSDDVESKPAGESLPQLHSSQADLARLQEAATQSCLCIRSSGDEAACQSAYIKQRDALIAELNGSLDASEFFSGAASACSPVSTEHDCFEFKDTMECITTSYFVVDASAGGPRPYVCTTEEARAIEQAFADSGQKGVDDMLAAIVAGDPLPDLPRPIGCAG